MSLVLTGHYYDILKEIGQWKIIAMKSLYKNSPRTIHYSIFSRKIKSLENDGFIKSIYGPRKSKMLILTEKGASFSPYKEHIYLESMSFNHDLITTNFILNLKKYPSFTSAQVQSIEVDLEPDGIIYGEKKGKEYSLAVEIELTQKSKRRVIDKLCRYKDCPDYTYLLYVFNKESVFKCYREILINSSKELSRKVILLLNENIDRPKFEYLNSKCFFKSKMTTFEEIF